jgi:hypothetical protein
VVEAEVRTDALPPNCPACGATVRGDVSWCTQCYAPLRRPPETVADVPERVADDSAPRAPAWAEATGPDGVRTTVQGGPASRADAERVAEQMLAQLSVERDELTGLTARLPSTKGGRAALVATVIVLGTGVVLMLMFVLGALL